jgi:putative hydrolase of HD superfamily
MFVEFADNETLRKQIDFIVEIDKLKRVYRRSRVVSDPERRENDAEHAWHLTAMALVLHRYAEGNPDLLRTLKMLIIHDLVEIDAGDTFAYDAAAHSDKLEREERAAKRLFGLLPEAQADEMYRLWLEFEKRETPEAKFAAALDRLQPILTNYFTEGATWREHGVTSGQVFERNRVVGESSPALWELAKRLIDDAVTKGYLKPS